jgi:hypothetical protein
LSFLVGSKIDLHSSIFLFNLWFNNKKMKKSKINPNNQSNLNILSLLP